MNRVFFYSLRLLLPALVSVTSSLHAEESEEVSSVDVDAILAAQPASVPTVVSQTKLFRASNAEAGDYFQAVAVSGDTVVVGAPFEDSNGVGVNSTKQTNNKLVHSGAAYVFVRDGEKWVQQAYLKASNPGRNDQFGFSVAISGDTIAIGAFGEDSKSSTQTDNSAEDAGAVYVFTRKDKIWTQQAYLKSSTVTAGNLFGYSVAISGSSLVVGAMGQSGSTSTSTDTTTSSSLSRAGAAYVFTRSSTTWSQQASLKASNAGANDLFGVSVGISGDTVVVGAQNESSDSTGVNGVQDDDTQSGSGAAYVFVRADSKWTQQAYLKASNTAKNDLFGHSVAIDGTTIVVGAHQESSKARGVNKNQSDNSALKSGAAYVFTRKGKKWTQQAYLKPSNTGAGDGFGFSVSISGASVVVGSYGEDSSARGVQGDQGNNSVSNSGAAYIYTRSGTTWSQKSYLKASNTAANGQFGKYVAAYDDTALIAAPGMGKYAGAAYLFEGSRAPSPEIVIERELATTPVTYSNLSNGSASVDFGNHLLGSATTAKMKQTFRIRNTGSTNLTGVTVTKSGTDLTSYELVQTGVSSTILPGESKTFTVTISTTATASTARVATITVTSNDADESEFKIALTGQVLSDLQDKDGDTLSDWAESQYASLGFDWKTSNAALVETLKAGASAANLYTTTEVQTAVRATTPVLTRNSTTGKFTLQLSLEKSTDLKTFTSFPMTSGTFKDGKLEFEFTSPDNASFYRVLAK